MKQTYMKPRMVVERFTLAQSIAKDCYDSIDKGQVNQSELPCVWDIGGLTILMESNHCGVALDGFDNYVADDGTLVCYNNPGEGQYIFRS